MSRIPPQLEMRTRGSKQQQLTGKEDMEKLMEAAMEVQEEEEEADDEEQEEEEEEPSRAPSPKLLRFHAYIFFAQI